MTDEIGLIDYGGIGYPVRRVFVREAGDILVSTTLLNDALVDCSGSYCTKDAVFPDEQIQREPRA